RLNKRQTKNHQGLNRCLRARIARDSFSGARGGLALSGAAKSRGQTHADQRTEPGQFTAADSRGRIRRTLREYGRCQQKHGGDGQKQYFTLHCCISLLSKIPPRRWFQSESWGTGGSHLAAYHAIRNIETSDRGRWRCPHKSSLAT